MRLPIAAKILIVLFLIFSVVLAVSLVYQNNQQKTLVTDIVGEQTLDKASNYFDSLNMMMLTGTIHQKEALRQKVLEQNGIEDARVIRADGITSIFGPGNPEQAIADSIDQRAVGGETIIENVTRDYGPGIVVALPMKASSSYRGTNCLQCHVVPEGTVLGVVRLEYNLSALYETINHKMLVTAAIMTAITLAGFALTFGFIRSALVSPLKRISLFMRTCSNDKNLSERITLSSRTKLASWQTVAMHFSMVSPAASTRCGTPQKPWWMRQRSSPMSPAKPISWSKISAAKHKKCLHRSTMCSTTSISLKKKPLKRQN